jgi:hypothetical protein
MNITHDRQNKNKTLEIIKVTKIPLCKKPFFTPVKVLNEREVQKVDIWKFWFENIKTVLMVFFTVDVTLDSV